MPLHIVSQCKGDVKWMGIDKMDYHPLSVSIAPSWTCFFYSILFWESVWYMKCMWSHALWDTPNKIVLIAESIIFRTKKSAQFQKYIPCSAYACDRKEVAVGEDSMKMWMLLIFDDIWCWFARMISLLISWRWSWGKHASVFTNQFTLFYSEHMFIVLSLCSRVLMIIVYCNRYIVVSLLHTMTSWLLKLV